MFNHAADNANTETTDVEICCLFNVLRLIFGIDCLSTYAKLSVSSTFLREDPQ